jgi:glycosyltransferase involved in cell wall biosynthesis
VESFLSAKLSTKNFMRVLLASIVPPRNDSGARVLMHRHLVERRTFELHVASNADFEENLLIHTKIRMPRIVEKIRKSRLGPKWRARLVDFQNLLWPFLNCRSLENAIDQFRPDVILTLAEPSLSWIALRCAKRRGIPFAAFFMDWFPIMDGHFGLAATKRLLDRRFRQLYEQSDLVFCICGGMQRELGPHRNSHVLYPIAGKHSAAALAPRVKSGKFRLVYVGIALGFYGRMLQGLVDPILQSGDLELRIVGPFSDWDDGIRERACSAGVCLGYKPPEEAAAELREADALLVVMSFEREHELFMRTSFNTKFADYTVFEKPIIFWAPEYAAPMEVARQPNATVVVDRPDPGLVVEAARRLARSSEERQRLVEGARALRRGVLNPDWIQEKFVGEMERLVKGSEK